MTLRQAILFFLANPFLFIEFLVVKLNVVRAPKRQLLRKKINGVIFEFEIYSDPAIKYMYINNYQPDSVNIMRRILSRGDIFFDVGANIGYLSAVGAGIVGEKGQVHSFEPVPLYFSKLENLSKNNPGYRIVPNRIALGDMPGVYDMKVTSLRNIGWNTLVSGFMKNEKKIKEVLKVPVRRLDEYAKEKGLNNIKLLKIDVEGFEFPVLKGMSGYFDNACCCPYIICEINPYACRLLGFEIGELSEYMKGYGYGAYDVNDWSVEINLRELKVTADVLFINSAYK